MAKISGCQAKIEEYEAGFDQAMRDGNEASEEMYANLIIETKKTLNILLQKQQQKEQQQQCNVMRPVPPLHCIHDHHR